MVRMGRWEIGEQRYNDKQYDVCGKLGDHRERDLLLEGEVS